MGAPGALDECAEAIRGGGGTGQRRWNSLDFLLDHARRDIRLGTREVNAYIREFAGSQWCEKLRGPEFHHLIKAKSLKKEIIEAFAVINLIRRIVGEMKKAQAGRWNSASKIVGDRKEGGGGGEEGAGGEENGGDDEDGAEKFDGRGMLVIDLCSGKAITATMMNFVFPKSRIIAIDKDHRMCMSHISHLERVQYHFADITEPAFGAWLNKTVQSHLKLKTTPTTTIAPNTNPSPSPSTPEDAPRFVVMVGVHLCGTLSEVAVKEFNRNPGIRALVLCPCCMPKKNDGGLRLTTLARRLKYAASAYQLWCWTVFHQIDRKQASSDLLQDPHMITTKKAGAKHAKNTFIYARRLPSSKCRTRPGDSKQNDPVFCER
eukprot:CAMPEP_0167783844 /NCGR_PEP_ID=MMETSP0111_2-20121227/7297_1 /TAXON_ID=91324 /ORGANISM="Lotharella globosa, Strain CCCM811" /LENGTH=374 /DNA_ID=CAMNT_0007674829 /DNA_START=73 /DNA_END=1194 /DNA_ORIENTATION=-